MRALLSVLVLLLVTGCATTQPSAYQRAAGLVTPRSLTPGARWAFVLLDGKGQISAHLVVKLSDAPIKTCDSGNYRRVVVESDSRLGSNVPLHDPSYEVVGAAVRIQLSSGLCDDGYAIIGGVTETGFEGVHMAEVLIAPKRGRNLVMRAYGVPVPE
jgi:hypothetical protein